MNATISIPDTTGSETTAKTPQQQKSATITLNGADGATLQLVAERKGDGARTYVITTGADKKSQRGMTETHATFEAAKAATEKMAKAAEKLGWKRRAPRKGFAPKPDAFSTRPAPAKAKK